MEKNTSHEQPKHYLEFLYRGYSTEELEKQCNEYENQISELSRLISYRRQEIVFRQQKQQG